MIDLSACVDHARAEILVIVGARPSAASLDLAIRHAHCHISVLDGIESCRRLTAWAECADGYIIHAVFNTGCRSSFPNSATLKMLFMLLIDIGLQDLKLRQTLANSLLRLHPLLFIFRVFRIRMFRQFIEYKVRMSV